MVKITLLNCTIMTLFIQDKSTLYSDLLQSYDNSMHSRNDYLFFDHIFYLELISFFWVFVFWLSITISLYQYVFISEHLRLCVCVYVHTRMYIDMGCLKKTRNFLKNDCNRHESQRFECVIIALSIYV